MTHTEHESSQMREQFVYIFFFCFFSQCWLSIKNFNRALTRGEWALIVMGKMALTKNRIRQYSKHVVFGPHNLCAMYRTLCAHKMSKYGISTIDSKLNHATAHAPVAANVITTPSRKTMMFEFVPKNPKSSRTFWRIRVCIDEHLHLECSYVISLEWVQCLLSIRVSHNRRIA